MGKNIRFKFSRGEGLKYISHLDILRLFERALRRSKLPVAYTQGFNPKQKLVFGLPMSVGLTSDAEYADIELEEDADPVFFKDALNSSLPQDIRVLDAMEYGGHDNIMNQISAARYEIIFETAEDTDQLKMDGLVNGLMSGDEIPVMKRTKKGMRQQNIRPLIYSLSAVKRDKNMFALDAFLSAGTENNLRADLLMEAMGKETGLEFKVLSMHRKALYMSVFNEWKDPFEVVNG